MTTKNIGREQDVDAYAAVEILREALDGAGIILPSLRVDMASPELRLVELGRIRADVAQRLAVVLQVGGRR